ncbi:MAG TPA: hypothetical protein VE978_14250 [Chitinophagales bacterium]|nr:hypothetical protein [Chitinophagales bacterium]
MKLLVDVKESKVAFVVELLNSLPFTKTKQISPAKAQQLSEMSEAIENLNFVKKGKLRTKPLKELLNEL